MRESFRCLVNLLLPLFIFSISSISFSNEFNEGEYNEPRVSGSSASDFLSIAKDLYDQDRDERKEKIKLKKTQEFSEDNFCVGCEEIKNLVYNVNKGLFHLSASLEQNDPKQQSLEHIEALEAMFHYTMVTNELGEQKCHKYTDKFESVHLDYAFGSFEEDESEVIFSNMVSLNSLQAIHLRDGEKKTYFYRAKKPHRDVVVKVDISDDDRARITYYKMEMTDHLIVGMKNEDELHNIKSETKKRNEEKDKWGSWFENKSDSSSDYFNYGAGFEVDYDEFLPKRLTLIKGQSLTPLTELLSIKTESEISSKRVVGKVSLTDSGGDEYVEVEVKTSKAEIMIPTKIDIFSTGYRLKTSIRANTDNEQGIDFQILGDKDSQNRFEIMSSERGMAYSVENIQKIGKKQSVSFKFTSDEQQGSSAFIRYELKL